MAYKVQISNREVIERKLLTALSQEGTVAMLCSEQDLKDLRLSLNETLSRLPEWASVAQRKRLANLKKGIELLLKEAF